MHFFVKGAVLGFLIAAPVGPIGVLCIVRTLRSGWVTGFASGLGAATADAFYAAVAAFGVKAVSGIISALTLPLHLAGAGFCVFLGTKILRAQSPRVPSPADGMDVHTAYASTVLLTLLNPATILSFMAFFAAAMLHDAPKTSYAVLLVTGVLVGSGAWWLALATGVACTHRLAGETFLKTINLVSGLFLIGFGCYSALVR